MGFGQYCVNCHASAKDNQTFSALNNIKGEPGQPLIFLSQNFFLNPSWPSSGPLPSPGNEGAGDSTPGAAEVRCRCARAPKNLQRCARRRRRNDAGNAGPPTSFTEQFGTAAKIPQPRCVKNMPPATYDNVWVKQAKLTAHSQFITSDQCLGCHDAGGTGVQLDMTEPGTDTLLRNISPYATWRYSPMGLAGRDPIFFAQLASETDTLHPRFSTTIQDTCFGCHGVLGQRQFAIDKPRQNNGTCAPFLRDTVNAVPFPATAPWPTSPNMPRSRETAFPAPPVITWCSAKRTASRSRASRRIDCFKQRQAFLNPGLSKLAATFTGSFFVGPPTSSTGPSPTPRPNP